MLSDSSSAFSPQELEKETTKNISVIYDAVRELEREGVITGVRTEGKGNYYRLNRQSSLADQVRKLFEAESEEYSLEDLPAHLRNILFDAEKSLRGIEGIEMIIVFGSLARGDFTPESDIDLYLVLEKRSTEKEDEIYDVLEGYEREFSVVVRERDDFEEEFGEEKSELAQSIMLEGFSILYSSSKGLEEVIRKGMGLEHLAARDLKEDSERIEKLKDFLAEYKVNED
ncbi:MAG: nucleotidyltransferase domain-containing protein [Candidatus Nanohalobium sp.]